MLILSIVTAILEYTSLGFFISVVFTHDELGSFILSIYSSPCLILGLISLVGGIIKYRKAENDKRIPTATIAISAHNIVLIIIVVFLAAFYAGTGQLPTPDLFGL